MVLSIKNIKWYFFLFVAILILSACAKEPTTQAVKEITTTVIPTKTTAELVSEIHDLDTETSFLYNNFDSDYTKYNDASSGAITLEGIKTVETYANKTRESGKKALEQLNLLLTKISELNKSTLNSNQRAYIDKLELASVNYKKVIEAKLKLVDEDIKLSIFGAHNEIFVDYYRDMVRSLVLWANLDKERNWKQLKEEIQEVNDLLKSAQKELVIMKGQIPFKFLDKYDNFITLMQQYVDNSASITNQKEAGESVSQEETNKADEPGYQALEIFKANKEGLIYVEGEFDEIHAYAREHLFQLQDEAEEAYNRASAYYDDASLQYEQLLRSSGTNSTS